MTEDTDRTPSASGLADAATMRVPTHEANNYSRILTLLGMEEEGDPVEAVDELLRLRCDCTARIGADGVAVTFCGSAQMAAARAVELRPQEDSANRRIANALDALNKADCKTNQAALFSIIVDACGRLMGLRPVGETTEEHDHRQERIGLIAHGPGNAQRIREVASFLRSSRTALEADAAVDCDRAVRWIEQATRALRPNV